MFGYVGKNEVETFLMERTTLVIALNNGKLNNAISREN